MGNTETTRFLSIEPQIERIDVTKWLSKFDWMIVGGESGNDARPFELEWAQQLLRQCRQAGVPFFLKQLGAMPYLRGAQLSLVDSHGGDWTHWPDSELRVREMPKQVLS